MIINKHREVSMETEEQKQLRLDDEKKDDDNGDDAENGDNGDNGDDKKEEGGDDATESD